MKNTGIAKLQEHERLQVTISFRLDFETMEEVEYWVVQIMGHDFITVEVVELFPQKQEQDDV